MYRLQQPTHQKVYPSHIHACKYITRRQQLHTGSDADASAALPESTCAALSPTPTQRYFSSCMTLCTARTRRACGAMLIVLSLCLKPEHNALIRERTIRALA